MVLKKEGIIYLFCIMCFIRLIFGGILLKTNNIIFLTILNVLFIVLFVPYCIILFFTTGAYDFLIHTMFFLCIATWLFSNIYIIKCRKKKIKLSHYLSMLFFNPSLFVLLMIFLVVYEKVTFEYHPLLQEALSKANELPNGVEINIEESDEFLKSYTDSHPFYFIVKDDITKQDVEQMVKWLPKDGSNYMMTFHREESVYAILFEIRYEKELGRIRCLDAGEVNDWCDKIEIKR